MARPPALYVAITNHGFGHATRATAVAAAIAQRYPTLPIILGTTAPPWLLATYWGDDSAAVIHSLALDVGVIQSDSLTLDIPGTQAALAQLQAQQSTLVAAGVEYLRQAGVGLVLADIPPLAVALAQGAGVPCWMMSNFGWDFIYRPWGEPFRDSVDWITGWFGQCDRLFRLPFHEPMTAFPQVEDVGLVGGTPRYGLADLRQRWALTTPKERTVMLTFGGLGLAQIPYATLAQFPDWQFITFDRQAPALENLRVIGDRAYRPVDFMPLCDRVVSKPGFSTFAEACRLGIPIATLPRDDFAEAACLLKGIQAHHPHQILDPVAFFQGDWSFLKQPPQLPSPAQSLDLDGISPIVEAVGDYLLG